MFFSPLTSFSIFSLSLIFLLFEYDNAKDNFGGSYSSWCSLSFRDLWFVSDFHLGKFLVIVALNISSCPSLLFPAFALSACSLPSCGRGSFLRIDTPDSVWDFPSAAGLCACVCPMQVPLKPGQNARIRGPGSVKRYSQPGGQAERTTRINRPVKSVPMATSGLWR